MTEEEAKSVLRLKSYTFRFKHNPEEGPTPDPRRYPGFIAEQGAEAGAELWVARQHKVVRDENGKVIEIIRDRQGDPVGFRTAQVAVAHNYLIKDLYDKIEKLTTELNSLRGRLDKPGATK
jgi:flavin-dependent dehydrogenase